MTIGVFPFIVRLPKLGTITLFTVAKICESHFIIDSGDLFASPYACIVIADAVSGTAKISFYTGQIGLDYFDGLLNNTYIEFRQRF